MIASNALPGAGLVDEPLGKRGALPVGHHPADHVAAEDVEHDVEIEVGPLRRAEQLGDVPAPQLVGAAGQQLRGGIDGMAELIAPLPHLRVLGQEAIHRAFGTDVLPGVEQRGIDLRRGVIHEARLMQQREDRAALARTERAGTSESPGAPTRTGTLLESASTATSFSLYKR